MGRLWNNYKEKAKDIRPFLQTKIGSRLAILGIIDFIVLFFAPLLHGFVGTAIFGCVASVYLILVWRRFDKEHVVVPAVILCVPMLLDMLIYLGHEDIRGIVAGYSVSIIAMLLVALSKLFGFYDNSKDLQTALLIAGAIAVAVVVAAWITRVLIYIAWWIFCVIAFFIVVAVFLGVVFSTAAYTASDGRRQARRDRERSTKEQQEQRYRDYRPRQRDTKIYNVDDEEDDDRDEEFPDNDLQDIDFSDDIFQNFE